MKKSAFIILVVLLSLNLIAVPYYNFLDAWAEKIATAAIDGQSGAVYVLFLGLLLISLDLILNRKLLRNFIKFAKNYGTA